MFYALHILASVVGETNGAADGVSLVVTAAVSATVFSAIITGLVQFVINRRNSRITERKNTVDAESDVITRYKEQAAEERAAKESAVRTIKELLADSREQVEILNGTIATLNGTIRVLETLSASQENIIKQLTDDRDRTAEALKLAEIRVQEQRDLLATKQQEIHDLVARTQNKIVTGTFDIA
ncbi:membrane protein [Microbacterium phage Zooman]|nr:membrane protein [Microbacterium phage Zooman]